METGKMTRSEAGKMGYEKSYDNLMAYYQKLREDYDANPKRCLQCEGLIPYEKRRHDFCSQSCSSIHRNTGRKKKELGRCLNCEKPLVRHHYKYCSNACQQKYQQKKSVEKWLNGKADGIVAGGLGMSDYIRRWVMERDGNMCSVCKGTEWMGKPMPLVLDHVDGNGRNNRPENLRIVCGNCNMLLPTFAGRNKGKGRMARKVYDDKRTWVMTSPQWPSGKATAS